MNRLSILAAVALAAAPACGQAQDSAYRFETKVIQLPAGARPHDAAPGRPGEIWYTAQRQGALGIVDIDAWSYRQVPLGEGSSPHGVVLGPDGIDDTPDGEIWYVSLAGSHLAKVDRADGSIEVIEPPHENAQLRRVWADSQGELWITGWNSGKLYRYRPASAEWTTFDLPGEKPQAYAVYVDARDDVWVTDFASNNTLVFDIATEKWIATIPGSGPNAQVRQILGRGDEVYLPESGTDRLMLVTVGG